MVSARRADAALRTFHSAGVLDPTRRTRREGDIVLVPVRSDPRLARLVADVAGRLEEDPSPIGRSDRRTPRERALASLVGRLPAGLVERAPEGWELLGDVLVLRLDDGLIPHASVVASAYAEALGARCVVLDAGGVSGELREMRAKVLLGDDPVTTHVENGVRFRLDASRLMFSSGNVHERTRIASLRVDGETVVDMFAGIGYFTLPLAVHAHPARILALEKNPIAHRYLAENVALNGVAHVVEPWLGDNRDFPHEGIAHRVLMGYFPRTEAFLPKALRLLRSEGGVLHFHNTAHAERWEGEMRAQLAEAAASRGAHVEVLEARVVKTHSPGVVHAVVVARVSPAA